MVNNGVLTTTLNIKVNYCSVISGALERGFYIMCTFVIEMVSFYVGNLWYLKGNPILLPLCILFKR